jgi:hypothetical protein
MIRQHARSLVVALFLVLALMGASTFGVHAPVVNTAPVPHLLACGSGQLPLCVVLLMEVNFSGEGRVSLTWR